MVLICMYPLLVPRACVVFETIRLVNRYIYRHSHTCIYSTLSGKAIDVQSAGCAENLRTVLYSFHPGWRGLLYRVSFILLQSSIPPKLTSSFCRNFCIFVLLVIPLSYANKSLVGVLCGFVIITSTSRTGVLGYVGPAYVFSL